MLSRVPEELHARVKQSANAQGKSMSRVVEEALEMYLSSVSFRLHFYENPGFVSFSIRNSEIEQLKAFVEDNESRLSDI